LYLQSTYTTETALPSLQVYPYPKNNTLLDLIYSVVDITGREGEVANYIL